MSVKPAVAAKSPVGPTATSGLVLANGLVLAEFDIDKGACVRTYYPKMSSLTAGGAKRKPIGVNVPGQAEYFANHMLPDGAEKLTVARTIFVVNRPRPPVYRRFSAFAFAFGEDDGRWIRTGAHAQATVSDILLLDMKRATLSVRFKDDIIVNAMPVVEGGVVPMPSMPPEVMEVANRLAATATAASQSTAPSAPSQPQPQVDGSVPSGAGGAIAAPTVDVSRLTFLVAKSQGDGRPLGLLMAQSQQEALFTALAKALAPPTPPPEPLFAFEEEPPHPVNGAEQHADIDQPDEAQSRGADDTATAAEVPSSQEVPSLAGAGGDTHVDPVPPEGTPQEPSAPLAPLVAPQSSKTDPGVDGMSGAGDRPQPAPAAATPLSVPELQASPSPSVASYGGGGGSSVSSPTGRPGMAEENSGEILYGLCAVVSKRDATARRGGRTKAVAALGPSLAWLEPFFPVLVEAAQYCCDIPGHDADAVQQQSKVLKLCYESINAAAPSVAAGMAKTSQLSTEVARYATLGGNQEAYATFHTAPFGTTHKTRIPLTPTSHEMTYNRYSLEGLIEAMGPSFLHLVKAIMTEKKIIVLSRMGLSTDVAEAAIALGTLGNLLDPTFIATKVFPYTSINSVDHFLSIPGYVIGTLNPIFENEKAWHWDVLCDLDKKTVVLGEKESGFPMGDGVSAGGGGASSSGGSSPGATSKRQMIGNTVGGVVGSLSFGSSFHAGSSGIGGAGMAELDALSPHTAQFFKELVNDIYRMRALRTPPGERNRRLRLILEEFMHTAVMVTYTQGHPDIQMPQTALKDHFMNPVLNSLRAQCRLTSMMDDVRANVLFPGEPPTLLLYTATLRRLKGLDTPSVVGVLQAVTAMLSSDHVVRLFLRRMTVAVGGLNPVGMQLTHPSQAVRTAALHLLSRVDELPEGKAAVAAMNGFLILVYEDCCKRAPVPVQP